MLNYSLTSQCSVVISRAATVDPCRNQAPALFVVSAFFQWALWFLFKIAVKASTDWYAGKDKSHLKKETYVHQTVINYIYINLDHYENHSILMKVTTWDVRI